MGNIVERISTLIDEQECCGSLIGLAGCIGASVSAMKNWAEGTAPIPFAQMVLLARLTDTSLDWLAYGDAFDRYIITDGCSLENGAGI